MPTTDAESPSYPRTNWWGQTDDEDPPDSGHENRDGVSKTAWLAHALLRDAGDPPILSATTLYEDPDTDGALHDMNEESPMSDPVCRVPLTQDRDFREVDYGVLPHRLRYDLEYGYVGGVVIGDRPTEEFLGIVEAVLDHCHARPDTALSESEYGELLERAHRLKRSGDWRDVDILHKVLEQLENRI